MNSKEISKKFWDYLIQLDPKELISCESFQKFEEKYNYWKLNQNFNNILKNQNSFSKILNDLKSRQQLYIKKTLQSDGKLHQHIITAVNTKWIDARKKAISKLERNILILIQKTKGKIEISQILFQRDASFINIFKGYVGIENKNVQDKKPKLLTDVKVSGMNGKIISVISIHLVGSSQRLNLNNCSIKLKKIQEFEIRLNVAEVGLFHDFLLFQIDHSFWIGRQIQLNNINNDFQEKLKPSQPFEKIKISKKKLIVDVKDEDIIRGVRIQKKSNEAVAYKAPLPYNVPLKIKASPQKMEDLSQYYQNFRTQFHPKLYCFLMHDALFFEEMELKKELLMYSMDNVSIPKAGHFSSLLVPGLAEQRPSVMKGDTILVHESADPKGRSIFEGCVHQVERDRLLLKFDSKFSGLQNKPNAFSVDFVYNRTMIRLHHQSVDGCKAILGVKQVDRIEAELVGFEQKDPTISPSSWLFPSVNMLEGSLPCNQNFEPFYPHLNEEQLCAVRNIAYNTTLLTVPYIIFGPPGTGKTVTLIESILQYVKVHPEKKVLICAPTNQATDLLLDRLTQHLSEKNKSKVFRFNAYNRSREEVIESMFRYCKYDEAEKVFNAPTLQEMRQNTYMTMTCSMASKLTNYGLNNHFDGIFIDEAGHALEPETLGCIAGVAKVSAATTTSSSKTSQPCCQLVLAGDPKQLGPVVRSKIAVAAGLNISLLERLVNDCPIYARSTDIHDDIGDVAMSEIYDTRVITKLLVCYRCHPDILHVPNTLFYDGELKPPPDGSETAGNKRYAFNGWEHLPNPTCPIIFHGTIGKEDREASSPSWFNATEVEVVTNYLQLIIRSGRAEPKDIAIITPYRKQVSKIRQGIQLVPEITQPYRDDITVGTCEQLQGQERRVIIISCVRSTPELLDVDKKFGLGFVDDPKRFNVAVTRAEALLIVIGNPNVLDMSNFWNELIKYSIFKGAYTGCHYEGSVAPLNTTSSNSDQPANQSILEQIIADGEMGNEGDHDDVDIEDDGGDDDYDDEGELFANSGEMVNQEDHHNDIEGRMIANSGEMVNEEYHGGQEEVDGWNHID